MTIVYHPSGEIPRWGNDCFAGRRGTRRDAAGPDRADGALVPRAVKFPLNEPAAGKRKSNFKALFEAIEREQARRGNL